MNWLDSIVDQHRELESPKSFWYWSALTAISAAVKDNIWLDRGGVFKTYPNIYVMLHAESGMKKGPPVNMAKRLVEPVGVKVITGRSSIQGILKKLGTSRSEVGGKIDRASAAFICSSELTSSIVDDPVATRILTDLYDRNYNSGEWESLLKMEQFKIQAPTLSMLTATNESMADEFFTKSAIQGGFFARTFVVFEREGQTVNSLVYPLHTIPDYKGYSDYLLELSKLKGAFAPLANIEDVNGYKHKRIKQGREIWFNETGLIYDDWYEHFRAAVKDNEIRDETGTLNRFGDSVLKVAMLLSLSREPKLEISPDAMLIAIKECDQFIRNVQKTTMGKTGMSRSAQFKSLVMLELAQKEGHRATQKSLYDKFWMHFDTNTEFTDQMEALQTAGFLKVEIMGTQLVYSMPDDQIEKYQRLLRKK